MLDRTYKVFRFDEDFWEVRATLKIEEKVRISVTLNPTRFFISHFQLKYSDGGITTISMLS